MAFKSITDYNNDRYGGMFLLKNDGDYEDVIIMYRNIDDVLVTDSHYIKSDSYSGYVHCLGRNCPACEKNIRVQPKLFIPVYVINSGEILFWDRSIRFQNIMDTEVFSKFPNPADFVFRITRNGAAGDINTRYSIVAVGKNNIKSYDEILEASGKTILEHYESICKTWDNADYRSHLTPSGSSSGDVDMMPEYKLTPRVSVTPEISDIPDIEIETEISDDVEF